MAWILCSQVSLKFLWNTEYNFLMILFIVITIMTYESIGRSKIRRGNSCGLSVGQMRHEKLNSSSAVRKKKRSIWNTQEFWHRVKRDWNKKKRKDVEKKKEEREPSSLVMVWIQRRHVNRNHRRRRRRRRMRCCGCYYADCCFTPG